MQKCFVVFRRRYDRPESLARDHLGRAAEDTSALCGLKLAGLRASRMTWIPGDPPSGLCTHCIRKAKAGE